jgi:hypothetical protein
MTTVSYSETLQQLVEPLRLVLVQGVQRGAKETPKGVQGVQGVQRGVKGCSVEQRKRPNTFNVKSLKTSEFKYLSVIK